MMDREIAFIKWYGLRVAAGWLVGAVAGTLYRRTFLGALTGAYIGFILATMAMGVWALRRMQARAKEGK